MSLFRVEREICWGPKCLINSVQIEKKEGWRNLSKESILTAALDSFAYSSTRYTQLRPKQMLQFGIESFNFESEYQSVYAMVSEPMVGVFE